VRAAESAIKEADGVLLQLEIPLDAVRTAIELARRHTVRVILNPAPAQVLPDDLLRGVDVLTPNEHEVASLVGGEVVLALDDVLSVLMARGPRSIVMTRGARGCDVLAGAERQHVPGYHVEAVDTTGAGA